MHNVEQVAVLSGESDQTNYKLYSRFYRDRELFDYVCNRVLFDVVKARVRCARAGAADADQARLSNIRCWSCGCSGGQEAYTMRLMWLHWFDRLGPHFGPLATLGLSVVGTDLAHEAIVQAENGCYTVHAVSDFPDRTWIERHFQRDCELLNQTTADGQRRSCEAPDCRKPGENRTRNQFST